MGSPTSNPRVNIQLLPAALVDAFEDRRDLIVGQIQGSGTATSGALVTDVHLKTDAEILGLFGAGELYGRIWSWRSAVNVANGGVIPKLDVIGVAKSGTGVAAAASVAFTGTATSAGTITIAVVDERKFSMDIAVASGDTASDIGEKVDTAVTYLSFAPFTSSNTTGTVAITANDPGTVGNSYGIKASGAVAGISYTVTGFTGGANDPTLTAILDGIEGRRYAGLSWPEFWAGDLIIATDEMDARFNASNAIMDGVVFHGRSSTAANAASAVASLNSQSLVIMGNNKLAATLHKGPAVLQPADWVAAYFMGARDKRLSTGAQIADLITATNAPRDATGGPALASLPYFNTPLRQTPVTGTQNIYSAAEQLELEDNGFTSFGVNPAGNAMIMGPVVTTWTTDAAGNANNSFHYLNYVDTGSVCREIIFRTLKATFAQSRLTEGDLLPGRAIENAASIKSKLVAIYKVLADAALVQAGDVAVSYFAENTTVEVSLATRTVTINGVLPIVTQLGTINYNLALAFTTTQTGTQITV